MKNREYADSLDKPLMKRLLRILTLLLCLLPTTHTVFAAPLENATPPTEPVKLIFVHHSTGGNWLADPNSDQPYGGLGQILMENNYFVSATNYGWGPDSIGDRTDIINWPEWFLGPNRDTYLDALYNEEGQNIGDFGNWSRMPSAPGGENQIIMFKSCFPNSDLYGNPNDPPLDEANDWEYSVANAKAIYNALLSYFETRQDKLFVVITAPPLMRSETAPKRADNARAFNNWLVNDWLNDYPYANVAVFDYYNVLTDPDNHHRWNGTSVEHTQPADTNFSAYPSGDSHPSTQGHSKATAEFVPLLNVFYHRWQTGETAPPPTPTTQISEATPIPNQASAPTEEVLSPGELIAPTTGIVQDFEQGGTWEASAESGSTTECVFDNGASHEGVTSLRITFDIAPDGWGDCGHYFDDGPYNWEGSTGLAFWLLAEGTPEWSTLMIFSGAPDSPTPFEVQFKIVQGDWQQITLPWDAFTRAEWADDAGLDVVDPARVTGYGINLGSGQGQVWIDEITLIAGESPPQADPVEGEKPADAQPTATEKPAEEQPTDPAPADSEPTQDTTSPGGPCASASLALPLAAVALVLERRRSTNHINTAIN